MKGLRSTAHWLLLAIAVAGGASIGIFALRSMVWAAAFAAIGSLAAAIALDTRSVRNTAVTLITVFACLLVGEGAIRYSQYSPPGGTEVHVANTVATFEPESLFVPDPVLGWKLRPSSVIRAVRARGEYSIYDATYSIDARGQRVTPDSNPEGDTVLFLGDSFMFGDGLPDQATVPQLFAARTDRRFHVVNLGVSAYGPHQVLRQIQDGVIDRALEGRGSGKVRAAVLYFNDDQLPRAAGDKNMEWWWRVAPQYERTADGLRLVGTAADAWDRRGGAERAISDAVQTSTIARTVRRFVRVYPQLRLSEEIVRQIRLSLREKYGVELTVIYWSKDPSRFFPTTISWMIERSGTPMLFIPDLMGPAGLTLDTALIPEDGHPNMRLNDAIAAALAKRYTP